MPNFNKVILAGHLTRDPELKYLPSNMAVCKFGLAVSRKWRDKSGSEKEEVLFIDCDAFGKTAETISKFMSKGRAILVEGRLKLDQWKDRDGGNRSRHGVVVDSFTFLGGNEGGGRGGKQEELHHDRERMAKEAAQAAHDPIPHDPGAASGSEIPF